MAKLENPDEINQRKEELEKEKEAEKARRDAESKANTAKVLFSTGGRFTAPEELFFRNYNAQDLIDLNLTEPDEMLEVAAQILDKNMRKSDEYDFSVYDLLIQEFTEVLIAIKARFDTKQHEHHWLCDCQRGYEEKDQKYSKTIIDLSGIEFQSIENADLDLQKEYKKLFENNKDAFEDYLSKKYNGKEITIEKALEGVKIKEPLTAVSPIDGTKYEFTFTRLSHLIRGMQIATIDFNKEVRKIKKPKKYAHLKPEEAKELRESEVEKLMIKRAKDSIKYSKALSLQTVDDEELTEKKKIEEFSKMDATTLERIETLFETVTFGVFDEREFTCEQCGKRERGWLQRRIEFTELLPLKTNKRNDAKRELGQSSRIDVYF